MSEEKEVKKIVKISDKGGPVSGGKKVEAEVKPEATKAEPRGLGKDVTVPEGPSAGARPGGFRPGGGRPGGFRPGGARPGARPGGGSPEGSEPGGRSGYVRQRFRGGGRERREMDAYEHSVILIRRTAKVMEGGKRMRFSAMVAVGDKKGKVGLGISKAAEPRTAIEKARREAKKNLVHVRIVNGTIPHQMEHRFHAAKIFMRPAKEGTGLIAGSSVRTVLELAGVRNAAAKIYGSNNKIVNAYCALEMLKKFKTEKDLINQRGITAVPVKSLKSAGPIKKK